MLKKALKQFLLEGKAVVLILLGTVAWSWTMVKSGWNFSYGLGFWGANGHDGVWHVALAESLSKGSLGMPVFAGHTLQNYHIGFDLILAVLHKITLLPIVNLYFQILPPILALAIGLLVYRFVWNWQHSKAAAWWSTFFVYFGGGFGYLIGRGESAFWSQQAISTLINPPFALSLVIILLGLTYLVKKKDNLKFWDILSISLLFGILIEIKIYAGLLVLGGLLVAGIYSLIANHKSYILKVFIGTLVVSLPLFLLLNKNSGGLIVWQPFWFLETMMGLSDRVGWPKFFSAMSTYKSGHIWIKGGIAYVAAFAIFIIGNLGTRIIGKINLWKWIKNMKEVGGVEILIVSVILAGGIIPTFFLQEGTPWNTIQFFYYSLFFSGILAGIATSQIKNKVLPILIIILTIPTTILTLKDVYIPERPPAKLSNEEVQALSFLAGKSDGVVLTYPFDALKAKEAEVNPPRPLYLYTSTAYVSAFSTHPTFLEDEINLDITGYNWQAQKKAIEAWYKESDQIIARGFLKDNNIKYIYWVKPQRALLGDKQLGLTNIFENSSVIIYEVGKQ
jgi:hypothetical protein